MKKITLILSIILLTACSSSKKTETAISSGNYDTAINVAVAKLRKGKTKKKHQELIVLLEDAFAKATARDQRNLAAYKLNTNPTIIKSIYTTYLNLDRRQDLIRPLLPLFIQAESREAKFNFVDYSAKINETKLTYSDFLYKQASNLLMSNDKRDVRNAYKELTHLNDINPGFKDVRKLLKEAHHKGTNFIDVVMINDTNQVIPKRLEDDLLNFSSYGINNFWTTYHGVRNQDITYDYEVQLRFKSIDVSPERISEKSTALRRKIKDGFEYVLDSKGNVATDSLGNSMKVDKFIIVKANYIEIHQEKASRIGATVILTNLRTNQIEDTFPIESEFVFVHDFAEMQGDIRALNSEERKRIKTNQVPFPTSEQMIFDTGEDLKAKFKGTLQNLKLN